jgi:dihydroorotate dehydrogenase
MAIKFLNGQEISTVLISTACGYDGRGIFPYTINRDYGDMIRAANETGTTRISKSMTRHRRSGNFHLWRPWTWKYIQDLGEDGMLNAYGLTNTGAIKYLSQIANAAADGVPIIPSIYPEFDRGREEAKIGVFFIISCYRALMNEKFWAVELNFSCPNTRESIADNVKSALWLVGKIKEIHSELIVIAKISVVHPLEFARQLRESGADVLHAVNTIPYSLLFADESPLQKVGGGGVSGGPAFEISFEYNMKVLGYFNGPVILGCGITDDQKLRCYLEALECYGIPRDWRSISLSFCTAALRRPEWVKEVIQDFNGEI